jgi:hypothetical protein
MITGITGTGSNQEPTGRPSSAAPPPPPPPQPEVRYVEVNRVEQSGGTPPPDARTPLLTGAVVALVAASIYNIYEINQLKGQLVATHDQIIAEVGRVSETSTTSTKTTRASVDALKGELAEARRQAAQMVGQAKVDAAKNVDILQDKLDKAQAQQSAQTAKVAESVNQVSNQVTQVKEDTKAGFSEVNKDVAAVRTQADSTNAELKKTIADLTSTKGDLGVQSGLIATNSKQIQALKELGERNYTEFRLAKAKTSQKVGDLQIRLTKADEKKNRYTVEVIVNDKMVEKKDKTINEPVQFMVPRYAQPFELVVNEVRKDMIVGYVSAPKVQVARN